MNLKLVPVEPKKPMKSNKVTSHHLMKIHIFYVVEGKDIACRNLDDKTGQLKNEQQ